MVDVTHGSLRTRIWPRPRGPGSSERVKETREWFRQAAWAMKFLAPDIQAQVAAARVGKPLLPRDLLMMMLSARLGQFHMPNGEIWRPAVAINDISQMLDFITALEGMTLVRGPEQWEGTPLPNAGMNWWFQPIDATGWTRISGDATDLGMTFDAMKGLSVHMGPPVTGDVTRAALTPIASPNQPWSLEFYMDAMVDTPDYSGVGVIVRDSSTGRLLSFTQRGNASFEANYWASTNAFFDTPFSKTMNAWSSYKFWKIYFDGVMIRWEVSPDGMTYFHVMATMWNAYFGARPDQIGIGGQYARATGMPNIFNVKRWNWSN